jgi:phospholipid/cholesterol/gamma-HCH transport system substrate-binding protein
MKALTWRSVSGGIAASVAIVALLVFVLKFARTGVLRGEKFRLYVAVPDANNLLTGSEVWLNGQRVGTVTRIEFAPASAPQDVRVVITAEVLEKMRDNIRIDSRANLRSGGTIIGAPVVYLTAGTFTARAVIAGDTLRGAGKSDFEIAASRATEALEEMPAIVADAKIIMANAKTAGARFGAIVGKDEGLGTIGAQTKALAAKLSNGRGSAGLLMHDQEIRRRIAQTMAATDTLRTMLATRMNEVGRFRRDSTLGRSVRSLRDEIATLRQLAASPTGTVGRITTDSALRKGLDSVFVELTALMADIKKNPLRYAKVF